VTADGEVFWDAIEGAKPSGLLSSERMDWRTPEWFLELVREVGEIDCDPATGPENPTRAAHFYSQVPPGCNVLVHGAYAGRCGLDGRWSERGLTFVNPPYGAHLSGPIQSRAEVKKKGVVVGVGKGWARRIAHAPGEVISLVPVRTETAWWQELFAASTSTLLWSSRRFGGRIRFIHPETGKPGPQPNLASTVFYHGPRPERFAAVFGPHGTLIRREK
jgi:hypothetical protein